MEHKEEQFSDETEYIAPPTRINNNAGHAVAQADGSDVTY
jgi:hypothetical protein